MRFDVKWIACATMLSAATGCPRSLRVPDPGALEYHPPNASSVRDWRAELRRDLAAADLEVHVAGEVPGADVPPGWDVVTRFVHISDVQFREVGLRYFGKIGERLSATVASATYRPDDLDKKDEFPLAALVGGVNARVKGAAQPPARGRRPPPPPDFLVHTGDAVDASSMGELLKFMTVANEVHVPWFDVVGNHDVFLMGNFTEDNIKVDGDTTRGLDWVLNRAKFMQAHGANDNVPFSHAATESGSAILPSSRYHGFDCLTPSCETCGQGSPPLRAYYSVSLATTPPIRLIVLDTTRTHESIPHVAGGELPGFGAAGYVDAEQFRWVQGELASAQDAGEAILVFGHHTLTSPERSFGESDLLGTNPDGKRAVSVLELLKRRRNVLAYFGGHTHVARITRHDDAYRGAYPFYEVIAPSLHEFPQTAYWVEVLRRGRELALRVRPAWGVANGPATDPVKEGLVKACAGARAHSKVGHVACTSDVALTPAALVGRVPAPVDGAVAKGVEVSCGSLELQGRVACGPEGASASEVDAPFTLVAGGRSTWTRNVACGAAAAEAAYDVSCSQGGAGSLELTVSSSVAARTERGHAASVGTTARGEIAPAWRVPVTVPAGGSRVRVAVSDATALSCRARVDLFADAPLVERSAWEVTAGEHAVEISCEAFSATCVAGAEACSAARSVDAALEVRVE
jgi:3',5'-cyclic AMP phosphodiesterase CpdA